MAEADINRLMPETLLRYAADAANVAEVNAQGTTKEEYRSSVAWAHISQAWALMASVRHQISSEGDRPTDEVAELRAALAWLMMYHGRTEFKMALADIERAKSVYVVVDSAGTRIVRLA